MIISPLLRSGRAEAQVLASEAELLSGTLDGRRLLLLDAPALITHCSDYPDTVRQRWKTFEQEAEGRALFDDDLTPVFTMLIALAETCRETVAAVRKSLETAECGRAELERADERAYPAPDFAPLDSAAERLSALKGEISAQWEWLNTPGEPHRPLPTTEEIRAALSRGEYISVEEAFAQAEPGLLIVEDLEHRSSRG
jgi:hypothetical protein